MTRQSVREIEHTVTGLEANLAGDDDDEIVAAYADPKTGKLYDGLGDDVEPVNPDNGETIVVLMSRGVTTTREQAEEEGWGIVAPAESDTNPDAELVTVRKTVPPDHVEERATSVEEYGEKESCLLKNSR